MKELEEEIRELQHQSQHLTFLCSQYLQSVDPTFKWNEVRLGVYDMADLTNALADIARLVAELVPADHSHTEVIGGRR